MQKTFLTTEKLVRTQWQEGEVLRMSLLEKLVMMCAVKFAALDSYGMGIEMEGGKPGWYDALNGLPGMFASSMNETYELCRMLKFVICVFNFSRHSSCIEFEKGMMFERQYRQKSR